MPQLWARTPPLSSFVLPLCRYTSFLQETQTHISAYIEICLCCIQNARACPHVSPAHNICLTAISSGRDGFAYANANGAQMRHMCTIPRPTPRRTTYTHVLCMLYTHTDTRKATAHKYELHKYIPLLRHSAVAAAAAALPPVTPPSCREGCCVCVFLYYTLYISCVEMGRKGGAMDVR